MTEALKRIRDLFECRKHGLPVIGRRGVARVDCGLALVIEGSSVKNRLRQAGTEPPEDRAGREERGIVVPLAP